MNQEHHLKIIQIFASSNWGGGEKYVFDLYETLAADGNDIVLVSKKSSIISGRVKDHKAYYQLPMKGATDLYSAIKLAAIIKREKPQIIHVHNFKDAFTAVYARMISGKSVRIILSRHLVKRAKTIWLYSWLYQQLDQIVFVSHLVQEVFLSSKPRIDQNKIQVVHNSINSCHKSTVDKDFKTKHNIKPNTILLAFSGRIVQEKGLEVLLDALAPISNLDFKLIVIGTGNASYLDTLKTKAQDQGLTDKIIWYGFVEEIGSIISLADIGVLPSIWPESFGLSIIEFMEQGKPVITTNNGAQQEFIEDGVNGFLIPPSDSQAITKLLIELIDNHQLKESIGKKAKEYFLSTLSYDKFYNTILAVYRNAIGSTTKKKFDSESVQDIASTGDNSCSA